MTTNVPFQIGDFIPDSVRHLRRVLWQGWEGIGSQFPDEFYERCLYLEVCQRASRQVDCFVNGQFRLKDVRNPRIRALFLPAICKRFLLGPTSRSLGKFRLTFLILAAVMLRMFFRAMRDA